jgi:N-acetylglucosaminyldiphosphoundecaprenol N-acetyl-beta-D-mannosaminyltransferase
MHAKDITKQKIKRDFSRPVISMLGMPIDVVSMSEAITCIAKASKDRQRTFISTPNLNFFLLSMRDKNFHRSLLHSDLVLVDGMPLIWIAKLLGIRGITKVSGSSLFESLSRRNTVNKIKVFFFGGADGIAKAAHDTVNSSNYSSGLSSAGYLNPGIGSARQLSAKKHLDKINAAQADFVVVSLGAEKGQSWILRNLEQLRAPIISHLGAVLAFTAGSVKRAPKLLQKLGLEWLWRIKEQPFLYRRYWNDSIKLCRLMIAVIVPYSFFLMRRRSKRQSGNQSLTFESHGTSSSGRPSIKLRGYLTTQTLSTQRAIYEDLAMRSSVTLDLSEVVEIDEHGIGQILILLKYLESNLAVIAAPKFIQIMFQYESLEHLFTTNLMVNSVKEGKQ